MLAADAGSPRQRIDNHLVQTLALFTHYAWSSGYGCKACDHGCVHRPVGFANAFLIEDDDGLTLIDARLPG